MLKTNTKPFKKYKKSPKEWNMNQTIETTFKKSRLNSKFFKQLHESNLINFNFHILFISPFYLTFLFVYLMELQYVNLNILE